MEGTMEAQFNPSGWLATTDCQPASAPRDRLAQFGQTAECGIIRDTFALLGDKWSLLIVRILAEGTFRFSELHRIVVGISQRMLTLTLRNLERDGLVRRTIYPEVPPRVEYELTPLGRTLIEPVSALSAWALAHSDEIEHHRASSIAAIGNEASGDDADRSSQVV